MHLNARPSQIVFGLPDNFLLRDVVIDTHGIVRLLHRAQYCDDLIDTKVIVAALREAELGIGY